MTLVASNVARLLRPKSVAIVGISPDDGSLGATVLGNLEKWGFPGDIHLVSRTNKEIKGRACVASVDELPKGIDAVVFCVPKAAVIETLKACARREAAGAVVFAAGFAEAGPEGTVEQDEMSRIAAETGMAVVGPNCVGFSNFVDKVSLSFAEPIFAPIHGTSAVAVITQSGAMAAAIRMSLQARDLDISFSFTSGNEAVLTLEDYVDFAIEDSVTRTVALFVEQIRRPADFLKLVAKARTRGKSIVMMHYGRSAAAQESAASHTGAIAGDYEAMRVTCEYAGVAMVDSLEELIDVTELLTRFPDFPAAGPAIITDSGAFKGLTIDYCDGLGLEIPQFALKTHDALRATLPAFVSPSNPLDVSGQAMKMPSLYRDSLNALLADPAIGSAVLSTIFPASPYGLSKGRKLLASIPKTNKPVMLAGLADESPVPPELVAECHRANIPFFKSPERAFRALARISKMRIGGGDGVAVARADVPAPGKGSLAEHSSKTYLKTLGLAVPNGALATTLDEAAGIADRIGYPVALKLQSATLLHKTELGGVILNLQDRAGLTAAWDKLKAIPVPAGTIIDGILVEVMGKPGVELILGARRDATWGPILMAGLGGIWAEALHDVAVLPGNVGRDALLARLAGLKGAAILKGYRGSAEADLDAVCDAVLLLGRLMATHPEIREIDINPFVAYPKGQGAVALDALIVCEG